MSTEPAPGSTVETKRHRVVIIGAGFGGVHAAQALADAPVRITLIDRTNHHLFQPLLYQVATGVLSAGQIAPALRGMFRHQRNVEVLLGEVRDIDLESRVVRAGALDDLEIPYETLIVAAGATHSYFGHDQWAAIAPGMKTLDDAARVRSRVLGAFEMAEQADEATRQAWLTFALVGAGPTGVELAGQIAVVANRLLAGEYRHIDPADAQIILLDAVPRVLSGFPEALQERARRDLQEMGVDVEVGAPVTEIDAHGVIVGDGEQQRRIESRTVLWAAGVKASPLGALIAEHAGARTDRAGRLHVEGDLSLPGHPEVFAIGDMVSIPNVPGTAQPAIQEGKYVGKVIKRRLTGGKAPKPFKYRDLGTMAVIGRNSAVADLFGRIRLGGSPAFLIWGFVHLVYLVGWGNRFGAVSRWLWTILARNRRERLISMTSLVTDEQARRELQTLAAAEGSDHAQARG